MGDASVWFEAGAELVVASGRSTGAEHVVIPETERCYIRVADWGEVRLTGVNDGRHEITPLGDHMSMSWGRTRGGVIAYETDDRQDGKASISNATQWFSSNGEIWGFDGRIRFGIDQGHAGLAVGYIIQCWMRFLLRVSRTHANYEVRGPFVVEAGVTGFEDLSCQHGGGGALSPAIEATIVTRRQLEALDAERIGDFVRAAADEMRHAYGLAPFSDGELASILADSRARA